MVEDLATSCIGIKLLLPPGLILMVVVFSVVVWRGPLVVVSLLSDATKFSDVASEVSPEEEISVNSSKMNKFLGHV